MSSPRDTNRKMAQVHGSVVAIAVDPDGPLHGVIFLGPAGAGKTSLSFALCGTCPYRRTRIVADDIVNIEEQSGALVASAPDQLKGLMELRGYGPVRIRTLASIPLLAAFDLSSQVARVANPGVFAPIEGGPATSALQFDIAAPYAAERARLLARAILVDKSSNPPTISR